MAVQQKSGVTADLLTVDATAKATRGTLYDASGNPLGTAAKPLGTSPVGDRANLRGLYATSTPRTVGVASSPHLLFSIEHAGPASIQVGVLRLTAQCEGTAATTALVTVRSFIAKTRTTGGILLSSTRFDLGFPPSVCELRAATASDGGTAVTLSSAAALDEPAWEQFRQRQIGIAAGYMWQPDDSTLPRTVDQHSFALRAGECLLVAAITAALVTDHYVINCCWSEYNI